MRSGLLMLRAMERAGWNASMTSIHVCKAHSLGWDKTRVVRDTIEMVIDGRTPAGWTDKSVRVLTRLVQALAARAGVSDEDMAMLKENLGG